MLMIVVLLMLWGFYTYSLHKTGGQVEFKYTYENPRAPSKSPKCKK